MRIVNRAARWTLAAVVAGSLCFGASQAVAAPSAGGEARGPYCFDAPLGSGCDTDRVCCTEWGYCTCG